MIFSRGMRDKISKYVDIHSDIKVTMSISGTSVYDYCCFGIDKAGKLSDERYMIFYNQTFSPNNEIKFTPLDNSSEFIINLSKLPQNIDKLVFTASIDGSGTMKDISKFSFLLSQNGSEKISMELSGKDFKDEKAIISAEFYRKDEWRIAGVANGFNGGLSALLAKYGGTEMKSDADVSVNEPNISASTQSSSAFNTSISSQSSSAFNTSISSQSSSAFNTPTSSQSSSAFSTPTNSQSSSVFNTPTSPQSSSAFNTPTSTQPSLAFNTPTSPQSSSAFNTPTNSQSSSAFNTPTSPQSSSAFNTPTSTQSSSAFNTPSYQQQNSTFNASPYPQSSSTFNTPSYQQQNPSYNAPSYQQQNASFTPTSTQPNFAYGNSQSSPYRPGSSSISGGVKTEEQLTNEIMGKISLSKDKVNLEKHVVNLSKCVVDLSKKSGVNLGSARAKVVVVLDYSGSMSSLYSNGVVQKTINRLVPLGLTFDDNGTIDVYLFQNDYRKIADLNLSNYENYVNGVVKRSGYSMGGTNYAPVLRAIIEGDTYKTGGFLGLGGKYVTVNPLVDNGDPTFILFITDGENSDRAATDDIIVRASEKNLFIQFIGIGNSTFNYLMKLDDMPARPRDNTGFSKMRDLERASDKELYTNVLEQFSKWLHNLQ